MARLTRSDIQAAHLDAIAAFPNLREAAALTRRMVLPQVSRTGASSSAYTPDEQLIFAERLRQRLSEVEDKPHVHRVVSNLIFDIEAYSYMQAARAHKRTHALEEDPSAGEDEDYFNLLGKAKKAIDALPRGQAQVDHYHRLITFFPPE